MTETHVEGPISAAMLFEAEAVRAETLDLGTTKEDEDMVDSASVTVKDDSMEPGMSRSASVEARIDNSSHKSTPSATPAPSTKSKGKPPKAPVQLIGHLPVATEDALKTFTEIPKNAYQYGTLGKSREALESMTCDCQYEPGQSSSVLLLSPSLLPSVDFIHHVSSPFPCPLVLTLETSFMLRESEESRRMVLLLKQHP